MTEQLKSNIRWIAEYILAPIVVTSVVVLLAWAWNLTTQSEVHEVRLNNHSAAIAELKSDMSKRLERLEDKVDRVLERLGERP